MNPPAFLIFDDLPTKRDLENGRFDAAILKHLRALRIRPGEELFLLDGKGTLQKLRCRNIKPHFSFDEIESISKSAPKPIIELCLSPPKGDALWEALTQSTELGVNEIYLFRSDHSQIKKSANFSFERAQRVSDAACEQCLQPWRVSIDDSWHELDSLLKVDDRTQLVWANEALSEKNIFGMLDAPGSSSFERIRLFIGPEGGWSESERQKLDAVASPLALGPLILRVPTACVAALYQIRLLYSSGK